MPEQRPESLGRPRPPQPPATQVKGDAPEDPSQASGYLTQPSSNSSPEEPTLVERDKLASSASAGPSSTGGPTSPPTDPLGSLPQGLRDRYKMLRVLGKGGFANVYLAQDQVLDQKVAIKILKLGLASDSDRERFLFEARVGAKLRHPNIAAVFDIIQTPDGLQMIMEYYPGGTLSDRLKKKGALNWRVSLDIARQVAQALDYAHKRQFVHRDVKPANIFLSDDGLVRLGDFGIAKQTEHHEYTQTGMIIGTPLYMAPEQATDSRNVDPRTDIYALGLTLYHMLTGVPPRVLDLDLVPRPFRRLIKAATAPDRNERLVSASQFIALLDQIGQEMEQETRARVGQTPPGSLPRVGPAGASDTGATPSSASTQSDILSTPTNPPSVPPTTENRTPTLAPVYLEDGTAAETPLKTEVKPEVEPPPVAELDPFAELGGVQPSSPAAPLVHHAQAPPRSAGARHLWIIAAVALIGAGAGAIGVWGLLGGGATSEVADARIVADEPALPPVATAPPAPTVPSAVIDPAPTPSPTEPTPSPAAAAPGVMPGASMPAATNAPTPSAAVAAVQPTPEPTPVGPPTLADAMQQLREENKAIERIFEQFGYLRKDRTSGVLHLPQIQLSLDEQLRESPDDPRLHLIQCYVWMWRSDMRSAHQSMIEAARLNHERAEPYPFHDAALREALGMEANEPPLPPPGPPRAPGAAQPRLGMPGPQGGGPPVMGRPGARTPAGPRRPQ